MSGSSASTAPLPGPAPGSRPSRRRRALASIGAVAVLAVAALLAAALVPSGRSSAAGRGRAVAAVAPASGVAGSERVTVHHVFDSNISARSYGALVSAYDEGVTRSGQLLSSNPPVAPILFRTPFAEYKHYAEAWAIRLGPAVSALTASLRTGDRAQAQQRWDTAFADYLHLGAVYGFLPGKLNDELAEVPPSTGTVRFPGLHRIEKGLWTGQPLRSLVPISRAVSRATVTLRRVVPGLRETPLDYTLRAHEILEDAQRDLMSGLSVPWSGQGVLGTQAGLVATDAELSTLAPLLRGRDNTLGDSEYWLGRLADVLRSVRRPDGTYPSLDQLTQGQLELIDGTLAGTLSVTQQIPDELDTIVPSIPNMPSAPHKEK